ncbi:hypothetical protein MUK42_13876 [Musa troglodytarum]|uniref:Uncharacterized protein n=1 Tax=Musa troglodytarum TaxID=320322 RepID=A0A9E7LE54_9LILI|nr:hypothetical protein MUK42_13876 [Musa troglodytarum]
MKRLDEVTAPVNRFSIIQLLVIFDWVSPPHMSTGVHQESYGYFYHSLLVELNLSCKFRINRRMLFY